MTDDQPAGFGAGFLPTGIQRRIDAEARAEERAERAAEAEREAQREAKRARSLEMYREQALERGEFVSALDLATGQVTGRSLDDVFAAATAAADREDARAKAREKRDGEETCYIDQEPVIHGSRRSAWPESEYQLERMVRQARDNRTWMAHYEMELASRQGRAAEHIEAARARAETSRRRVVRSVRTDRYEPVIYR